MSRAMIEARDDDNSLNSWRTLKAAGENLVTSNHTTSVGKVLAQ
jgi:hypothetical protein